MAVTQNVFPIIPSLPRSNNVITSDGGFTSEYRVFFEQLIQALQQYIKYEGITIPQQSSENIESLSKSSSFANIIYDSTSNLFKGNVLIAPNTYEWKTFTLS